MKRNAPSLLRAPLLAVAVASCAGVANPPKVSGPSGLEIDAPVPATWSRSPEAEPGDSVTGSSASVSHGASDWWRDFEDPDLDRLLEIVLAANRDLRSAAARLDVALAQARIAGAELKPAAGLSVDAGRRKQNFIGLPIPGAEGRVLSNTSSTLGAALNVSWEVDLWGRIRDRSRAARALAEAAALDLEAARLSITGQAAKAWFGFVTANGQVALAREELDNRTRIRERIERRYRQGLRTALDLRLAIADEASSDAVYALRKRQRDAARRQLEVLLGRSAEGLEMLTKNRDELPALPAVTEPGLPEDVLSRRPDLRASERRLAAAGLEVAAARKLLYPRITLGGSTGRTSNELSDLSNGDFSVWSLAAGLVQPLFQGGRLRAGVELSRAARLDALARHENAVIRAVTEVEAGLADDAALRDQENAVAAAKEAAIAARTLAENRYFSGLANYLSVLAAQNRATNFESQFLDVRGTRLTQRVDLYLALGGGPGAAPRGAPAATSEARVGNQTEETSR